MNSNNTLFHKDEDLLNHFNSTHAEFDEHVTLIDLFEEQVRKTPDQYAIVGEGILLTYEELNKRANRLAYVLRAKGVGQNQLVAVMAERSSEMMVGLVGILKAGGAYLPIDPSYPKARIAYLLEDSGSQVVLTQQKFLHQLNGDVEAVDLGAEGSYSDHEQNPVRIGSSRDLAYVIYTSGSTGNPNGVMIEHRSVINRIGWMQKAYPISNLDVILQKTPISFDVSVWELFWWMFEGATMCLLQPGGEKDPEAVIETIEQYGVTTMHFVPSMLSVFLNYLAVSGESNRLSGLRQVFASGEALGVHQVNRFHELMSPFGARLIKLYGPTEATVDVTHFQCDPEIVYERTIPIGKPIDNTRLYIVDEQLKVLPVGEAGELCLAGVGLARGYLNREELTREKFVEQPFAGEERIYRTGDLAMWMPDGNIEYLGRIDHQVKIRGYRIELGELEERLREQPEVKDAVVIDRGDQEGQQYLCGYLIVSETVSAALLKERLCAVLPGYMVPSHFVFLDEFPLSPNGKLDRKALPQPANTTSSTVPYTPPRNELEQQLSMMWEKFLGLVNVGIHDNFFDLGGHSLKVTALKLWIAQEMNREVPFEIFFQKPTIAEFASYLEVAGQQAVVQPIVPLDVQPHYALSSAQKRMYIMSRVDTGAITYNIPMVFRVEGHVDLDRLEAALRLLIGRHESLRTSIHLLDGEPVQVVHPDVEFRLETAHVTDAEAENEIRRFVKPFEIDRAPLMRAKWVEITEDRAWFLLDFHHIISDGASGNVLFEELSALYEGKELAPLSVQYKDFVPWQESVQQTRQETDSCYWMDKFADEVPVLNLFTDKPRPSVPSSKGATQSFHVGRELKDQLQQVARRNKATLNMVLTSAFKTLLHKYTGQDTIIVGTPLANRQHSELSSVVGMFVNTLPLKVTIDPDTTFDELVQAVRDEMLAVSEHQNFPFEKIVEGLGVERVAGRNPIFDTVIVLQNLDDANMHLGEAKMHPRTFDLELAKFDLSLIAYESEQGISFDLEYRTSLYTDETMQHFAQHFLAVLAQMSRRIKEIELLSAAESAKLLLDSNGTRTDFSEHLTVAELFEEQVERHPGALAVRFADRSLAYADLNAKVNQLARRLRAAGLQPQEVVAVMSGRSPEMVIGALAVIKAGGAYLPLDPTLPTDRLNYLLTDSGARIVLTEKAWSGDLLHIQTMIRLDDDSVYAGDAGNLAVVSGPQDRVNVMYTSGTTGNPKGVEIMHRNIARLSKGTTYLKFSSDTRLLQTGAVNFDAATFEMWTTLLNGGCLFLVRQEQIIDPIELRRCIEVYEINTMFLTTALMHQLAEQDPTLFRAPLRHLLFGGDAASPTHVFRIMDACPDLDLFNCYGPTENTVFSTLYPVEKRADHKVPIGKSVENSSVYLLDRHLQLVPIGVPGELCVGGAGLARGYLNRPDLTMEKFIAHPHVPGERIYRTGDLARRLPDGNIEFLGRIDHQVKIRGFRIELGEIEYRLLAHPCIKEAAVTAKQFPDRRDKQLVAYYTTKELLTQHELRQYLNQQLPDYMVPTFFLQLDELPLTATGKINWRALPEPDGCVETGIEYVAPRNHVERNLAALWQKALGLDRVGLRDRYYDLGGNSLSATLLLSEIQKQFEVQLPLSKLLNNPTIESLALEILETENTAVTLLTAASAKELYPVSSQQNRLYIDQQLDSNSTRYNVQIVAEIHQLVDADRLETALRQVIERHEALRTSFVEIDGERYQLVEQQPEFTLERWSMWSKEAAESLNRPYDLERAALLRAALVPSGERSYRLLLNIHHIITDGFSAGLMFKEIAALYNGLDIPPVNVQYKDYSEWWNEGNGARIKAKQEAYWLQRFEQQLPTLELPIDFNRKATRQYDGRILEFEIDEARTQALRRLAQEEGATLFHVMVASYNAFLMKMTGQEDIAVGTPVSGRNLPGLDQVMGMFVNTVCLRNRPEVGSSFLDFLQAVKEGAIEAFDHQDYPFDQLVSKVVHGRDYSRNPLFDTMIALQNTELYGIDFLGGFVRLTTERQQVLYDLNMQIYEMKENMLVCWEYSTGLFTEQTMDAFRKFFVEVLDAVIADPNVRLGDIELNSEFATAESAVPEFDFDF